MLPKDRDQLPGRGSSLLRVLSRLLGVAVLAAGLAASTPRLLDSQLRAAWD